ncbi:glutathione peroxidase [Leuconostoc carnosum]|uniref:Glutathione peroxidase n=2 Tax=Leuconostoc carnosum TaxID=1252 RepID=K0DA18_LEUCJ|nr:MULTISPECIES: glutathione peroxidase [Leuconostoc]AFT81673.1 glutathione peroxidase [Leuconostoc carnosum JB16]KAA8325289.1 glutathione peroxidase [Leuconostoc carnosum]KAA8329372.1 glutathione peroxidase [Leuconostoc carnosum]KAA8362555.1 glutathione peroxidase [Leuconostoc carnosum]KAA8367103.1 glutathione peroxidase [Leuconostoc carnosum]
MATSVYEFEVLKEDGTAYSLESFRGQPLIIVNTATKCGYAPQFEELEAIYQEYKDQGLVVLGFPSNQFKQELGSSHEAAESCRLTYGVTFPMHHLISVNGKNTDPLFKYLKDMSKGSLGSTIKWNFTKFLVDKDGQVVERFAPMTSPKEMIPAIKKIMNK